MLITEKIKVNVISNNYKYYRNKGYECNIGDFLIIDVSDLPIHSKYKVTVKCEYCDIIKEISYSSYLRSGFFYTCFDSICLNKKRKKNNLEKYGVEHTSMLDVVKNKVKETNLERYGVSCSLHDVNIKEKVKETILVRYGVEHISQSEIIKNKIKENNLERYGVEHTSMTEEFKIKVKETNLERYGVENVNQVEIFKNKAKETNLERYGVENPTQNKEIRDKVTNTMYKRYGVSSALQNEDILEKLKNTNLERYGVEYSLQNENVLHKSKETLYKNYGVGNPIHSLEILEKIKKTNREKYGFDYSFINENIRFNINKTNETKIFIKYGDILDSEIYNILSFGDSIFTIYHKVCNNEFKISTKNLSDRNKANICLCTECFPISENSSIKELELRNFVESFNIETIKDKSILEGKELDIYIPSHNLAIEFNGLYWHSELYKEKKYHLNKSLECQDKGVHLIHIWEDEWLFKQEIVKSIISNRLGKIENKIFARNCIVKEVVDNKTIRKFLDTNHIQGFANSTIKLGLYYNDELVSLMTFGKRMIKTNIEFELIRFCNQLNTNVIGASSKLFKHFLNKYEYNEIISYSDFRLFDGKMYETLGFTKIHLSVPEYYWVKGLCRYPRYNFMKHKLIKKGYDASKTEVEIMHERGYNKIWGCGQHKWIYKKIA